MATSTLGLNESPPAKPRVPPIQADSVTFGSIPERLKALEALLTVLVVKGSVFTTSAELDEVQKVFRESDELNTPVGREMDRLLDRLRSAVEDRESRGG